MLHVLAAIVFALAHVSAALAQNLVETDITQLPSIEKRLGNPESLYPSGGVVSSDQFGVYSAYYETLTDRYGHNIFAGNSEYTVLGVKIDGKTYTLTLESDVFEDTYPLIYDLDDDGRGEIITIQSSLTKGASIAAYAVRDGILQKIALQKIAQTPYIGTAKRWMNIAGIADFNGGGLTEIAVVDRPHIRGELEFWTYTKNGKFELRTSALGFSNHYIGSSAQQLSAVVKIGDKTLLALPSTDRTELRLVDASGSKIKVVAAAKLSAPIAENFATAEIDGTHYIGLLLADGSKHAFAISP